VTRSLSVMAHLKPDHDTQPREVVREKARVARDLIKRGLQKIWVQAYKNAWHVPWSSTNSLYTFPTAEGGHECPLPSGVLTQALLQHVDQCMRHEDVVKKNMLAQTRQTRILKHVDQ